jgi:hypothetical protein
MKNLTKIFVLAAVAVLAVVSCDPEVDVSKFDMERENAQFDPDKNTFGSGHPNLVVLPTVAYESCVTVDQTPTKIYRDILLSVTLDPKSDALRESDIGSALSNFLFFYKIQRTNAIEANIPSMSPGSLGTLDTLSSTAIPYNFVKRLDNNVYIRLDTTYSVTDGQTNTNSPLVYKVDSTNYTFANGLKVDTDRNGTAGEADYDDFWGVIANPDTGTGSYGQVAYSNISLRQNMGWSFGISNLSGISVIFTGTNPTVDIAAFQAVTLSAAINGSLSSNNRGTILTPFGGSFELQKYVNGSWNTFKTSTFVNSTNNIVFEETTIPIDHLVPYRVVWKGGEDPKTQEPHFGFNQRIYITGGDSTFPNDTTGRAYLRTQSQINGPARIWNNANVKNFISLSSTNPSVTVGIRSMDSSRRNVTLELVVGLITRNNDTKGLREVITKDSFKFFIGNSEEGDEIEITAVELDATSNAARAGGHKDTVLITLDPSQQVMSRVMENGVPVTVNYTLCVNNGLEYDNGVDVFGNMNNIYFDFFSERNVTFPTDP